MYPGLWFGLSTVTLMAGCGVPWLLPGGAECVKLRELLSAGHRSCIPGILGLSGASGESLPVPAAERHRKVIV